MANSAAGPSKPDGPDAKTSSIAGVLSSLKRFSSFENIKPHFDLSRRHAPEKIRGPKAGTKDGTTAQRRFPVIPNTESRFSTTRSAMMSDLSESHTQAGTYTVTVTGGGHKKMNSNASLVDLSSHRVSGATVLTGEGRRTLRRSTRSTLDFLPSPITPEEGVAPDFPKATVIQPPPQAKVTETKSRSSSLTHIAAGPSKTNVESVGSTPAPTITIPAARVLPDLPPKVLSKHPNSSTLTLTKSSTVTKITNFITMEPNNPPAAAVELTPLSTLITQSRNDLQTLRSMNAKSSLPTPNESATATPPPTNSLAGMGKSLLKTMSSVSNLRRAFRDSNEENDVPSGNQETEVKEPEKEVDYDKIEANLDRFEDLYAAFLGLSNSDGEQNEEVHLLTVVTKRGEVVRGVRQAGGIKGNKIPERDVVPPAPRPATDCGL